MLRLKIFHSKWCTNYTWHVTLGCPFSGPTFWRLNGLVLSLVIGLFGKSFIQIGICLTFSKCSFRYHANMSPFMCKSKGRCFIIIHLTTPIIHLSLIHLLTTLHTHLGLPHPAHFSWCWCGHTINNLGTHLFRVPLWEWAYTKPWYTLKYYRNYCIPPFTSPHAMMSGYPYHQKWLPNLDGCRHH
jgi:hypothetical protein